MLGTHVVSQGRDRDGWVSHASRLSTHYICAGEYTEAAVAADA